MLWVFCSSSSHVAMKKASNTLSYKICLKLTGSLLATAM